MIFKLNDLHKIKAGNVTQAFRKWKRPSVKKGSTIKTAIGLIQIVELEIVHVSDISPADAHLAGYGDLDDLLRALEKRREGDIYKISVRYNSPDPRIELRNKVIQSNDEFEALETKLKRLDSYSKQGHWTLLLLKLIESNPHVRARDLANQIGVEKDWLKLNVRKLKNLGLTISLEVGYKISTRGESFLTEIKRRKRID